MPAQKEESIDLRSILRLLYKRLGLIILVTFIVTVLGSVYTFFIATPMYTATTQLVAKLPDSNSSAAYAGQVTGNIQMANTINQVIVSPVILDKVQNNLNLANDNFQKNVTASNTTNSQVITLTVKYSNPYTAQKIANETAKIFSDDAGKLLNVTNVSILAQAKVNTAPVSPRPTLYLGASVVAGLIIGIAIAFLMEALNNKITKEEDLEALGLSVLGVTPYATESDFANVVNSAAKMPSASGNAPTVSSHTPSANSHSATTSRTSSALTEKPAPRRRR